VTNVNLKLLSVKGKPFWRWLKTAEDADGRVLSGINLIQCIVCIIDSLCVCRYTKQICDVTNITPQICCYLLNAYCEFIASGLVHPTVVLRQFA
jgi:hypothetical protein